MGSIRVTILVALALLAVGCASDGPVVASRSDITWNDVSAAPEDVGLDSRSFIALTEWVRDHQVRIFSFLVSRNGRLVYELYTSSLTRDHAHYQMSATKSVVSALVGIAIDRRLISGPDAPITEALPSALFESDADVARFRAVTIHHVLGMSALDAPDPPRVTTPEAVARHTRFRTAPNRLKFALTQPLLARPGSAYQYNDVTPMLAIGAIQYATGMSALEFAEASLFKALGFRNHEWMHQDRSGFDLGGFGLRLRPIDMQKFGVLYLNGGTWQGVPVISPAWIERSFTPWNRSRPALREPDYGWFWWAHTGRSGSLAHLANGWKGQRIAVLRRERLVVTMTGCLDEGEHAVFDDLVDRFVVPSVRSERPLRRDPKSQARLDALLEQVRIGPSRITAEVESRMVPSITAKERHASFKIRN